MALTAADVHNVAFSRARVGKRGCSEQEVDLFIDLVEQELIRHIEEDAELRHRNAELRNRDGGLKKREAELAQREAALHEHESEVRRHETELGKHQAQLSARGAEVSTKQVARPYSQQLRAVPTPVAVNGASHVEETRVASVHGRHDMERMAIRAVTDTLGNTVTETVHERTRRSAIENGGQVVASDSSDQIEQLRKENAELSRSLGLIKSAAALLAAALDQR